MGRQISAMLTDEQELALLAFVRNSADVELICAASPTADGLFCQQFAPRGDWRWSYYLWNRAFSSAPEISQHQDHVSIGNTNAAPIIEYTRHNFNAPEPAGRLYWARNFSAPGGLAYEAAAFNKWFESVVRWVRRHCRAPLRAIQADR
jgi:hypothetical protein